MTQEFGGFRLLLGGGCRASPGFCCSWVQMCPFLSANHDENHNIKLKISIRDVGTSKPWEIVFNTKDWDTFRAVSVI